MAGRKQSGLGRGLSALMADVTSEGPSENVKQERRGDLVVAIDKIYPNPNQPRRRFARKDLEELAESIREKGIIQPLVLRKSPDKPDSYEIIAGERRWRAAQISRLHEVPAIIRDYSDAEALEIAIIENIQRADLNAIEEAAGYRDLMDRFGHTQERLSEALGKSRPHIANLLRLLSLPESVQELLREERLSAGHARALVTSSDPEALARQVVARGLSVRETEKLAKGSKPKKVSNSAKKPVKDADTRRIEDDLSATLKMRVKIDHKPNGQSGQVTIKYKDFDDLDEICRRLAAVISPKA